MALRAVAHRTCDSVSFHQSSSFFGNHQDRSPAFPVTLRSTSMKRILSLALAGLIAAATVATLVQPAMADGIYRYNRHGPAGHWHGHGGGGWNAGGAFV